MMKVAVGLAIMVSIMIIGGAAQKNHDIFSSEVAAWVQGLGSIAAVAAAAWIANGEARDRRAREAAALAQYRREQFGLMRSAMGLAEEAARAIDELRLAMLLIQHEAAASRLAAVTEALRSFPIHTVAHSRVVEMVLVVRGACASAEGARGSIRSEERLADASRMAHAAVVELVQLATAAGEDL